MAVDGRVLFRGSVRSLNPIESKYRVKGNAAGRRPQRYLCTGMRPESMKVWVLCWLDTFQPVSNFFAWQNGCDYRQCVLIKASVFLKGRVRTADSRDGARR